MNHTDSTDQPAAQWIDAWLESQRAMLQRWQSDAVQATNPGDMDPELLRKTFNPDALTAGTLNMAQSFQTLLQAGMAPFSAQFTPATDTAPTAWQQVLQAFALGPAREQQTAWQEYLQALHEYQARQQTVVQAYGTVFMSALEAVRARAGQRSAQGNAIGGVRELYELWIDCGEQAFAQLAHDNAFIAAQAASANAASRLKLARNTLLDYWLKSQDLPTRGELNSVHLHLRALSARVTELEQQHARSTAARPVRVRPRKPGA